MSKRLLLAALPLAAALFGCADPAEAPSGSRGDAPRIVCTTGIIADAVRQLAGDDAQVEALMGPGVDPHLYKASEGDVRKLADADLIVYNGLHLEGKMAEVLAKLSRTRATLAVAEALPREHLHLLPETEDQFDPHVWFDVSLWARTVEPLREALASVAPAHGERFARRAATLSAQLAELDRWVEQRIGEIPPQQRVLVTAHDAFGYFGRRYGVRVVGLQGISTLAEAGIRDVERVVEIVVAQRVPAIFVESSVPRRSIEAVQAACRARGHRVEIGGELFSDALGPGGTPEGTYDGMVRHNVNRIVDALTAGVRGAAS